MATILPEWHTPQPPRPVIAWLLAGDPAIRWQVRYPGAMPVEIDAGEGQPSRWNTLRALRVIRWYAAGG